MNKQYAREEYFAQISKIKDQMSKMPYVDSVGREYRYKEKGFLWYETNRTSYQPTTCTNDLPDHIKNVGASICNEIISCRHSQQCRHECTGAYRIIEREFEFLLRTNLPLPRLCPNCRHYERLTLRNPPKFWHRSCMCSLSSSTTKYPKYQNTATHFHGDSSCPNEFETSYAPDRKEIVYCEGCYQQEVV